MFLERGFAATSMDDIAEHADVARKTAFNHFARKRDFIAEWGARRRAQVEPVVAGGAPTDPVELLRRWFDELAKINQQDRALTRRMLDGWREAGGPFDEDSGALAGAFTDLVDRGYRDGSITADARPARVGTLLYSAYFGVLYDWVAGSDTEEPFDLREAFEAIMETVLHGVGRGAG